MAAETTGIDLCPEAEPRDEVPPSSVHHVAFTGGADGPFLASALAEFRDDERAERFMEAVVDAFDECERYEVDGEVRQLERFTVRGLGEQSAAARVTAPSAQGEVGGPIYYVRVGRRVVTVAAVAPGGSGQDPVARDALEAVLARL